MTKQTVEQRLKEAIELVEGMPEHERGTYANNNLDFARALEYIREYCDNRVNGVTVNDGRTAYYAVMKDDIENIIEEELTNHE